MSVNAPPRGWSCAVANTGVHAGLCKSKYYKSSAYLGEGDFIQSEELRAMTGEVMHQCISGRAHPAGPAPRASPRCDVYQIQVWEGGPTHKQVTKPISHLDERVLQAQHRESGLVRLVAVLALSRFPSSRFQRWLVVSLVIYLL